MLGTTEQGDAYVTDCGPTVGGHRSRVTGVQVYIYIIIIIIYKYNICIYSI